MSVEECSSLTGNRKISGEEKLGKSMNLQLLRNSTTMAVSANCGLDWQLFSPGCQHGNPSSARGPYLSQAA